MLWAIIAILLALWALGLGSGVGSSIHSRATCYCGDSAALQPDQRSPDTELTRARNHSFVASIIAFHYCLHILPIIASLLNDRI